MKKFIKKIIVFLSVVLSVYMLMSLNVKKRNDIRNNDYMLAMIDKHQRVEGLNSPKLIFAGGSNLAFGLDSERIQEELDIPVVNLGLHAGLGLDFMLKELKDQTKEDDIVVVSFEYFLDNSGDRELKKHIRRGYAAAQKYYPINLKDEILSDIFNLRLRIKFPLKEVKSDSLPKFRPYTRSAFNIFGDHIAHLEKSHNSDLMDRSVIPYTYWSGIKKINKFSNELKEKGVELYFMYPPYPSSEYEVNKETISMLDVDISADLEIEILSTPEDFVMADSLFFDTIYHLNKDGREYRTDQVIKLLEPHLSSEEN
ncbi:hypothetical protein [Mongoliitalea lutea]|uniref:Uncharacterized protein n=1 Tax=Mongoliitalea lutea TaxID=849756 RepID=A0A8J3G594_9BACT|nr:hypothetical protein [Mongoliitalea lutea]GHB37134.1 hypothetical protein GCM10008106_18030 [Mongoliitalea lutea]